MLARGKEYYGLIKYWGHIAVLKNTKPEEILLSFLKYLLVFYMNKLIVILKKNLRKIEEVKCYR